MKELIELEEALQDQIEWAQIFSDELISVTEKEQAFFQGKASAYRHVMRVIERIRKKATV